MSNDLDTYSPTDKGKNFMREEAEVASPLSPPLSARYTRLDLPAVSSSREGLADEDNFMVDFFAPLEGILSKGRVLFNKRFKDHLGGLTTTELVKTLLIGLMGSWKAPIHVYTYISLLCQQLVEAQSEARREKKRANAFLRRREDAKKMIILRNNHIRELEEQLARVEQAKDKATKRHAEEVAQTEKTAINGFLASISFKETVINKFNRGVDYTMDKMAKENCLDPHFVDSWDFYEVMTDEEGASIRGEEASGEVTESD